MRLSEGPPFKLVQILKHTTKNLNRANRYENDLFKTYRQLNCSGASPTAVSLRQDVRDGGS